MFRRALIICAAVAALCTFTPRSVAASSAANEAAELSSRLAELPGGPNRQALDAALSSYLSALSRGAVARSRLLTLIDYTRPSTEPRLWVLDLDTGRVIYRELVAHGRRTGDNIARYFSNEMGSLMTSLGLFVTELPYIGQNGYSLRLRGLDPGINDHAYDRAIVLHGAPYVSEANATRFGRLGRSWGCPAVRPAIARRLIDTVKGGTVLFAYGIPAAGSPDGVDAARNGDR
jgi:L,D-transpeptidase catalytic domain